MPDPLHAVIINPIIEFTAQEWGLLVRAWAGLAPDQKAIKARALIEQKRAAGQLNGLPPLPSWDDIVKIPPLEAARTADEIKARRRALAVRIHQSPVPAQIQALGSLVNAIDNAEDIASFVALLTRLTIRLAPKLMLRLVPGLNVLVTASDVLNILTAAVLGTSVAAGFVHRGALGAATQAAGIVATKALFKHELWELLRLGRTKQLRATGMQPALSRMAELNRFPVTTTLASRGAVKHVVTGAGDILEALQATETLWGWGLSLGAIVGYIQELAWSFIGGTTAPVPPDRKRLAQQIAQELPHEYVILQDDLPRPARPCWDGQGMGPAWSVAPEAALDLMGTWTQNLGGYGFEWRRTCVTLWSRAAQPGPFTEWRDLIAWRVVEYRPAASGFQSRYGHVGPSDWFASDSEPAEIPTQEITYDQPALARELRALLNRLAPKRRRRAKRGAERAIHRASAEVLREWERLLRRRAVQGSPLHLAGAPMPIDMPPDIEDAAPYLTRLANTILTQTPWLLGNPHRLTMDEHLRIAAAYAWAATWAADSGAVEYAVERHEALAHTTVRVPYHPDPHTRTILRELRLEPATQHQLPLIGSPRTLTLPDLAPAIRGTVEPAVSDLYRTLPPGPESHLLSALYHHAFETLWGAANHGEIPWTYVPDPGTSALLQLAHHDLWPPTHTHPAQLARLLDALADAISTSRARSLTRDDLTAIYRSLDIQPVGPRLA